MQDDDAEDPQKESPGNKYQAKYPVIFPWSINRIYLPQPRLERLERHKVDQLATKLGKGSHKIIHAEEEDETCLLYTSDAADE